MFFCLFWRRLGIFCDHNHRIVTQVTGASWCVIGSSFPRPLKQGENNIHGFFSMEIMKQCNSSYKRKCLCKIWQNLANLAKSGKDKCDKSDKSDKPDKSDKSVRQVRPTSLTSPSDKSVCVCRVRVLRVRRARVLRVRRARVGNKSFLALCDRQTDRPTDTGKHYRVQASLAP